MRKGGAVVPEQLRYTAEHEWVAVSGRSASGARGQPAEEAGGTATGEGERVRVGITHYAQDALGDIVFLQLPEVGSEVTGGEVVGEVESTKSVSEIYAPVGGMVVAVNDRAVEQPEIVNSDPYGDGWLMEIAASDLAAVDGLLDATSYRKLTDA